MSTPLSTAASEAASVGEASTISASAGRERAARAALRDWALTLRPRARASSTTTRPTWPVAPMTRTVRDADMLMFPP